MFQPEKDNPRGLIISQMVHSRMTGDLAFFYGNSSFPAPTHKETFVIGAKEHDRGFEELDHDRIGFMTHARHVELFEAGFSGKLDPIAEAIVKNHIMRLADWDASTASAKFLRKARRGFKAFCQSHDLDPKYLTRLDSVVNLLDSISFNICNNIYTLESVDLYPDLTTDKTMKVYYQLQEADSDLWKKVVTVSPWPFSKPVLVGQIATYSPVNYPDRAQPATPIEYIIQQAA